MRFTDLKFNPFHDGVQAKVFFDNGFGASIIKHGGSYGNEQGLFELAVLSGDADEWSLCYSTPITDDVLGYQNDLDIETALEKIKKLKKWEEKN